MVRWLYFNEHDEEAAERMAVIARIDAWWDAFGAQVEQIEAIFRREVKWDLPAWMLENLQAIHPEIKWEFGPAVHTKGHRLVMTPESSHELRPLVATILERAPSISGWEFYDARLAVEVETAKAWVLSRTGYDISNFRVRASFDDHRQIDLCYELPNLESHDESQAQGAAFVATECLLGERRLDRWIGCIEIGPPSALQEPHSPGDEQASSLVELDDLRETVDSMVESLRSQLPDEPHSQWVESAEWTMWELNPTEADDYPQRSDLLVGRSANPPLWRSAHASGLFFSERFTRCGETFCYVEIELSEELSDSSAPDRFQLERTVDETLISRGVGCQIGGGMGLRYAYMDLAVTDVPAAILAIRECLREAEIPRRSWILLFDSELECEWVGIYEDTPGPPMREPS